MVKSKNFFCAIWRPNYLSDMQEILYNKIAYNDLSETVFRMTLPFLEAEICTSFFHLEDVKPLFHSHPPLQPKRIMVAT